MPPFRRTAKILLTTLALAWGGQAAARDKITILTSWYAQAEHGGFYQAKATGLYEADDLDVTIKMGGPQVNSMQLLLAGEADVFSGFDFQTLYGIQQGFPLVAIGAAFQHDMQGVVTHPDVTSLAGLKEHTIFMATSARTAWWPWLKRRYGLSDEQTKPYTFNSQPFILDANAAEQAYPSSEPFGLKNANIPYRFFLFADDGYPPYGGSLTTRRDILDSKPDVLRRFLHATMAGWKSYLADPAPGNALIKVDNPKMSDAQLAFAIEQIRALHLVDGDEATKNGIGTMSEARWKATFDYMVEAGLIKPEVDWHKAFTTSLIDAVHVLPTTNAAARP